MSQAFLKMFHQAYNEFTSNHKTSFLEQPPSTINGSQQNSFLEITSSFEKPNTKRKYTFKKRTKMTNIAGQKKNTQLVDVLEIRKCMAKSCDNGCINRYSFNEILSLRKEYASLGSETAKLMFVTACRKMANNKITYVLDKECCLSCFKCIYGITSHKWRQATKAHKERVSTNANHGAKSKGKETTKKESALVWFKVFLEVDGQHAPNSDKIHLSSSLTWSDIFDRYKTETTHTKTYSSMHPFRAVVEKEFPNLVLPKYTRLGKCQICSELKLKIGKSIRNLEKLKELREEQNNHNKIHMAERRAYMERSERARRYPDKFETIIIDGAEGLMFPSLYPVIKNANPNTMLKVGCYGMIAHGAGERKLSLSLPIFGGGANLACTILYDHLREKKRENKLASVVDIQTDNCPKEAKNRYSFGCLGMMVSEGWVEEIYIHTMIVGHTHADIDQVFSTYSCAMSRGDSASNVATPEEFIEKVKEYYTEKTRPKVSYLTKMYDWKKFFDVDNKGKLLLLRGISDFHAFKIFKKDGKPVFQVKEYSFTEPVEDYYGPDNTTSTYFEIFDEMPVGQPELVQPGKLDDIILSDLKIYDDLIDESAKKWLQKCKDTGGHFILENTLPDDFWLENCIQSNNPISRVNEKETTKETRPAIMRTKKKSTKSFEEPELQFKKYNVDEYFLYWSNESTYNLAMVVSNNMSSLLVLDYPLNDDHIASTNPTLKEITDLNTIILKSVGLYSHSHKRQLLKKVVERLKAIIKDKKRKQEEDEKRKEKALKKKKKQK